MIAQQAIDYAQSGMTIQAAMVDHARRFSDKHTRPPFILWRGLRIMTADAMVVPHDGVVQAEFIRVKTDVEQGFDLKVEGGFRLQGGEEVSLLRTWYDPQFEDTVEYPFHTSDGRLRVWNVFKVRLANDRVREDKWTGNAGFWVENLGDQERIYHCSPGSLAEPDFDALVLRVRAGPAQEPAVE